DFRTWKFFGWINPSLKSVGNMLHDAGYATCYTGKWQLDGGGESIKIHGFDDYLVFMPFNKVANGGDQYYRRYKNPFCTKMANTLQIVQLRINIRKISILIT